MITISPNLSSIEGPAGLIIWDRDGTLIEDIPNLSNPNEILWREGVLDVLSQLTKSNYIQAVASNQRAINSANLTVKDLNSVSMELARQAFEKGGVISTLAYCPHGYTRVENDIEYLCDCRKPRPGLLDFLVRHHNMESGRILFLGNTMTDREAALNSKYDIAYIGVEKSDQWLLKLEQWINEAKENKNGE